ncbi:MAG: protein-L-isoaspartate(D-aspartate) O-methyltransferase [Betaproteobacteria bacterium]|nr:protein-L-isoaspartate(D-aspartate) O-methyltransferase [Betaproteobacteria bacterium]
MNALNGIGMTSQRTRERMVKRVREQGVRDEKVLAALAAVPRHVFVDEGLAHRAYEDTALPLGHGQTISQPYIVARMIELLLEGRRSLGKALEIGAGCGYQAAVLARLSEEVYAVERIGALLERTKENLRKIREFKVRLKHGDGQLGLPEAAPFDTIVLAAATPELPEALLQQLREGGRMMLPLGSVSDSGAQVLCRIERKPEGFEKTLFDAVRFVPLLSGVE